MLCCFQMQQTMDTKAAATNAVVAEVQAHTAAMAGTVGELQQAVAGLQDSTSSSQQAAVALDGRAQVSGSGIYVI